MPITIDRDQGLVLPKDEHFGLECPYCGVFAHMTPQSLPDFAAVHKTRPKYLGLVFQCDACHAPVFLRFGVKNWGETSAELLQNFFELERPRERFAFSYLPNETEVLFREALSCYASNNFNAFASMCRRSAASAFRALGDSGKLRAFDEVMVAQEIAGIDDDVLPVLRAARKTDPRDQGSPLLRRRRQWQPDRLIAPHRQSRRAHRGVARCSSRSGSKTTCPTTSKTSASIFPKAAFTR